MRTDWTISLYKSETNICITRTRQFQSEIQSLLTLGLQNKKVQHNYLRATTEKIKDLVTTETRRRVTVKRHDHHMICK
jgi:hypothetical protein